MYKQLLFTILFTIPLGLFSIIFAETVGQLPFCDENSTPGLVLVSSIDGKITAVNYEGKIQWQIETEPGGLLKSNIHNLELTNSGKWIRIIPSLTGSLYRFDGLTIDPIPITAESLLRSSFKYSEDLIIAGGLDIHTYGVGFHSGKIFYRCSSLRCVNDTNNENEVDDILLLERSTQTVRAVETLSGNERWNFSVGYVNVKLPQVTCAHSKPFNWTISAVIPEGLLIAKSVRNDSEISWQHQFSSPIVKIWKWNGNTLSEIDLFPTKQQSDLQAVHAAIYIGMHNKQLYVHESNALQQKLQAGAAIAESSSLAKIPWKPVSASHAVSEDDSTALSVLYSSDYVNGQGYFLFSEPKPTEQKWCAHNKTIKQLLSHDYGGPYLAYWKEILVLIASTGFVFHLVFKSLAHRQNERDVIFVERHVELPVSASSTSSDQGSDKSDTNFNSRYNNDFDTLRCLGKGGFGVVFEVKQKIDECHYAIKRIILPTEESKRDAVMREVKALAKLEHSNIVRYFNSWVEKPPPGWQEERDKQIVLDITDAYETTTHTHDITANPEVSELQPATITEADEDSLVVFQEDSAKEETHNTNLTSSDVNWRKPQRCFHKLNQQPAFLYIQMQLCQKESLKEWLTVHEDRTMPSILHIFEQIVSAVEYIHINGLIHRDLKPSNIFFSLDGRIKVGDFGLVKDIEESYDIPNASTGLPGHTRDVGTRLYMSPEQLGGKKYNYKVDIYSLGLIFFELLVHFTTDMERITTLSNLRENIYPPDFIDQHKDEYKLLSRMLCPSPQERFTTFGIKRRPPLSLCGQNYNEAFDFDLPKVDKTGPVNVKI